MDCELSWAKCAPFFRSISIVSGTRDSNESPDQSTPILLVSLASTFQIVTLDASENIICNIPSQSNRKHYATLADYSTRNSVDSTTHIKIIYKVIYTSSVAGQIFRFRCHLYWQGTNIDGLEVSRETRLRRQVSTNVYCPTAATKKDFSKHAGIYMSMKASEVHVGLDQMSDRTRLSAKGRRINGFWSRSLSIEILILRKVW